MIPEIGHFALVLALVLAVAQSTAPLIGARRNDATLMGIADYTAPVQAIFVALSFVSLCPRDLSPLVERFANS